MAQSLAELVRRQSRGLVCGHERRLYPRTCRVEVRRQIRCRSTPAVEVDQRRRAPSFGHRRRNRKVVLQQDKPMPMCRLRGP